MSNDLLLVRETEPGWYNMSVGEPFFLQQNTYFNEKPFISTSDMTYPPLGGKQELVDLVKRTNTLAREFVIITNGAKQALLAALYAYKVVFKKNTYLPMHKPYWLSYPTLLEMSGYIEETNIVNTDRAIHICTSPNNPDGIESFDNCDIWDAAYYSNVYGATYTPRHWVISVWSAAKMYGLSGARIGYATTSHMALARAMAEYVEKTTSGVSTDSQDRLIKVLKDSCLNPCVNRFETARKVLLENGRIFKDKLIKYIGDYAGVPRNGKGMFAWVNIPDLTPEKLHKAKVRAIPGNVCGVDGSWWRFSMGHSNDITEMACESIAAQLG